MRERVRAGRGGGMRDRRMKSERGKRERNGGER